MVASRCNILYDVLPNTDSYFNATFIICVNLVWTLFSMSFRIGFVVIMYVPSLCDIGLRLIKRKQNNVWISILGLMNFVGWNKSSSTSVLIPNAMVSQF